MDKIDRPAQRLNNLLHDVDAIVRACSEDRNCPFRQFDYSNYVFRFEYHSKNEKRYYWVNLSEDYPNGSLLTWTVNGSDGQSMKQFEVPLPFIFNRIAKELYREISIPIVSPSHSFTSRSRHAEEDDDSYDDDDDDYDDGCSYDNDEINDNSGCQEDKDHSTLENRETVSQCRTQLLKDFENLQLICEDAKLDEMPVVGEVDIGFSISTDFLEDELARAWRLIPREPIVVHVFFSYSNYCYDVLAARAEVYQMNDDEEKITAGVLIQLRSILTSFVKNAAQEHINMTPEVDSKFKSSRKTPPAQMYSSRLKVPRRSSSVTNCDDPKTTPNRGRGLLVDILGYAEQRLVTLNDYCVICDELHSITNSAMLKPMVCDRPLCIFSYQTLGVMSSVTDDIAVETEVVDLLIAVAKAACNSTRFDAIFNPYPTIVHPERTLEFAFTPEDKTSITTVREVMKKFISMEDMSKLVGTELKTQLDATDKLIFPLMQWIISSNRSHIVALKPRQRLSFMKTPHQFLLRSSPPAKEAAFNAAKATYGSVFAFHGSPIENWHSILRKGLINASGTKLQINGAAHGKGIYLSPEAALSFSYSSFSSRFFSSFSLPSLLTSSVPVPGNSLHLRPSQGITCIALCEVVDSKILKKTPGSLIWVMPEEDYVVTRFLFVYEALDTKTASVRSDNAQVLAEIRKAIQG